MQMKSNPSEYQRKCWSGFDTVGRLKRCATITDDNIPDPQLGIIDEYSGKVQCLGIKRSQKLDA